MKSFKNILFVAAIPLVLAQNYTSAYEVSFVHHPSPPDTTVKAGCNLPSVNLLPYSPLSENEKQGLLFMREEEKLAHDVYITLGAVWDIPIFSNISRSESVHMEAVLSLLEKYEIQDPVKKETCGDFSNTVFTGLYESLVKQGNASLVEALKAGAFVEETDIADLRERIKESDNDDIKQVYENLLQASYRHFRAFNRNLAFREATYQPQRLSQKEFDEILEME